jgi:biopolymer transport protein ExbD
MSELESNSGAPNLTPILDMVFQLITFFMMVCNFKMGELDQEVNLPAIGSARGCDTPEGQTVLVLNVKFPRTSKEKVAEHPGLYWQKNRIDNKDLGESARDPDIEKFIRGEAHASAMKAGKKLDEMQLDDVLPTMVVLRSDQGVHYGFLSKIIKACQDNHFQKFALKAIGPKKAAAGGAR